MVTSPLAHREGLKESNTSVPSSKPLANWTKEEVQQWFLSSKYSAFATKFPGLNGIDLAGLSKGDFVLIVKDAAQGIVLYNAVQALKGQVSEGMYSCCGIFFGSQYTEKQLEQKTKELEAVIQKSRSLRDSLRKDPRYEMLYNKAKREMLVHGKDKDGKETFIPQLLSLPALPILFGAEFAPKGYRDKEAYENFLLTKDRYRILKELENFILGQTGEIADAGITPSGPHGIGKSGIGLLLACYAFLNNHFLVYIVHSSDM